MARIKTTPKVSVPKGKCPPAKTPEAREKQLIALATDLAEEQLRNGTASAQVITHYLKLGSSREKIEQKAIQQKTELDAAKKQSLKNADEIKELYTAATKAMASYSGNSRGVEFDDADIRRT